MSELPPSGWYTNIDGRQQWWTGSQWTDHFGGPAAQPARASEKTAAAPGRTALGSPREKSLWRWVLAGTIALVSLGWLAGVMQDRDNWPGNVAGWLVIAPTVALGVAGVAHIVYAQVRVAWGIDEARRGRSVSTFHPRLKGWLLVYAVISWPLVPLYIVATEQQDDPDSPVAGLFGIALILFGVWTWRAIRASKQTPRSNPSDRVSRRRILRAGVPACVLVALFGGFVVFAAPVTAQEAEVVRVVDGDTVDVRVVGGVRRIRILNIDTPETVDPNKEKECLGPEAARFTRSLIPVGTQVNLKYDEVRQDRFGRTLAHIELSDGRMVSTELARAGLGAPLVVGPNDARIAEIESGVHQAVDENRGFFDPRQRCTFRGQAEVVASSAQRVLALNAASGIAAAAAAATSAATISSSYESLRAELAQGTSLGIKMYKAAGLTSELRDVERLLKRIDKQASDLKTVVEERTADRLAKKRAAAKAAAKQKAKVAAARKAAKEADAKRKAKAAAARKAADKAARDRAAREEGSESDGSGGGDPYPGYTGPRCYAPGGKTWRPC